MELDQHSLLLTNKKYIKLPQFLNQITQETIGSHKLFSVPFDPSLLLALEAPELKRVTIQDLNTAVNVFPLSPVKFVLAQRLMAQHFHQVAKYRWAEAIQKEMLAFIKDDFDFPEGREMTVDQIDPALVRLFYQLKAYMQSVIYEHFEAALSDYLKFLLSFVLRDPDMRTTRIVKEIQFSGALDLGLGSLFSPRKPGEIINDTDLIPLRRCPMIHVAALVADLDVPGKVHKKQKVVTKPELDAVSHDLFSVVLDMHSCLHEIDRVDGLVFPLLQLEHPFLPGPDAKNDKKLQLYVRVIESLID